MISFLGDLGYSLCLNNNKLYEERNTLLAYSLIKATNGWNDNLRNTKPKLVAGVVDCKNVSGIIEKLNTVTSEDVDEVLDFFSTRKIRKNLEKLSPFEKLKVFYDNITKFAKNGVNKKIF